MSFNFDLSKKTPQSSKGLEAKIEKSLESNLPKAIQKELSPKSTIRAVLQSGGTALLRSPTEKSEVVMARHNFLKSYKDSKINFTNYVDLKNITEPTRETLRMLIDNIEFVSKNTEQVELRNRNAVRLIKVLKHYMPEEVFSDDNNMIFKVDGVSTCGNHFVKENPFRIYLKIEMKDKQNIYQLIFCDIYHLCLPTYHGGKTRNQMLNQTYARYSYCKEHLEYVLKTIEDDL
ncbi:hypothetical protein [Enterococcus asini]|uniref:hypothetical protein n=1 Tax=Enterococcus asini TaxID=57732 RepID=UPI001E2A6CF0|nr:hypothetical protein [Enterococcus asini]MCD5030189.1 hypothetical protein [Enterococcus asini]